MWLKEQIRCYVNAKKLYGNQGDEVNYPPTAKPMGGASRVNAPTNVGNLP